MKQKIADFHLDAENHWVAELECGHAQHVRHDPPWRVREWVTTEEGRNSRLGQELNCVRCDEAGLCAEGRWEAALSALDSVDIQQLLRPKS